MPSGNDILIEFLESIPDSKLDMTLYTKEDGIYIDYDIGYRIDHQGVNNRLNDNGREYPYIHRLYIQPVKARRTKTKTARRSTERSTKAISARCHATDGATPQEIRDALYQSYRSRGQTNPYGQCFFAPPKEAGK